MGAAAVPIFIGASVISAGASVYGGIQANKAAHQEAALLQEQGQRAQDEANREAALHAEDVRKFRAMQSMAFIKNGVTLVGSPLLVLDETAARGQEEVDAIVRRGASERALFNQRGVIARSSGRAALISGIMSGAGTVAGAAATGANAGLFKTSAKPALPAARPWGT